MSEKKGISKKWSVRIIKSGGHVSTVGQFSKKEDAEKRQEALDKRYDL